MESMINIFENLRERRFPFGGLLSTVVTFLIILSQSGLGGTWSINGSAQYLNGEYIYTTGTSTYYLSGGVRYQTERWNVGISVPGIAQNNDLVSGSGAMFVPSGHTDQEQGDGGMGNGHHGGGMMDGNHIVTDHVVSHFEFGVGDVYLSGQYQLMADRSSGPSVAVSGQIKFPTASKERNYGTGEFDYGMTVNLAKRWKNYAGFLDVGYWLLGDTPEINYKDPFTYGIGMGRFFDNGNFSALLYYRGYSAILENYDPPRQGSLGLYYRTDDQTIFSLTATAGFSDTSPHFGLSVGFNRTL